MKVNALGALCLSIACGCTPPPKRDYGTGAATQDAATQHEDSEKDGSGPTAMEGEDAGTPASTATGETSIAASVSSIAATAPSSPLGVSTGTGAASSLPALSATVSSSSPGNSSTLPASTETAASSDDCAPGSYVSKEATADAPRVCKLCGTGYYTSSSNQDACIEWTDCGVGTLVEAWGSTLADVICRGEPQLTGTTSEDGATGVFRDAEGYVISGWTNGVFPDEQSSGARDAFLAAFDASGNLDWVEQFGSAEDDQVTAMTVGADGTIYVTGTTWGDLEDATNAGQCDVFVRAYQRNHTLLWQTMLGSDATDSSTGIATDSLGNIYVVGETDGVLPNSGAAADTAGDAFVVRLDGSGSVDWSVQLDSGESDAAAAIAIDDDVLYIVGHTAGKLGEQAPHGDFDAFVVSMNTEGELGWVDQIGTSSSDEATSVAVDNSGLVYVGGTSEGAFGDGAETNGTRVAFALQLNPATQRMAWANHYGYLATRGTGIALASDGSVYLVGKTSSFSMESQYPGIFVLKLSNEGESLWSERFDAENVGAAAISGEVYAYGSDSNGDAYVFPVFEPPQPP